MRTLCLLVVLLAASKIHAQNSVINPGFESLAAQAPERICSHLNSEEFNSWLPGWSTFEAVTPDVIRLPDTTAACSDAAVHQGFGAAGLYNFHPGIDAVMNRDYHEYIQGTLRAPLIPGETYQVEVWVQLNNTLGGRYLEEAWPYILRLTPRGCNNLGFFFSEYASAAREDFQGSITDFNLRPQVNFSEVVRDEGVWVRLQATFVPQRPFKYFVIGNFFSDFSTKIYPDQDREQIDQHNREPSQARNKFRRYTYFLLDDIYVGPPRAEPSMEEQLTTSLSFTFKNLQFNSGEATLLAGSFAELDELVALLDRNTEIALQVSGHTDNVGSETANQQLSEARAKAVVDYLVAKGVEGERLQYRGFGESVPIATNETPSGRSLNRRVVIEIR